MRTFVIFTLCSFALLARSNEVSLPSDVEKFIDKRDGCDHFRGEPAYDKERLDFLLKSIKKLCTGTDSELFALKVKYKNNSDVISKLSFYEEVIE